VTGPRGPEGARVSRLKLGLGGVLVVLGVVLWIMDGSPAFGLISGLGVVFAYSAAEPWLERWRNS
jgi:hypothetical protein